MDKLSALGPAQDAPNPELWAFVDLWLAPRSPKRTNIVKDAGALLAMAFWSDSPNVSESVLGTFREDM